MGDISFSLYLWRWSVVVLLSAVGAVVASCRTVATGLVVMMILAGSLAALAHRGRQIIVIEDLPGSTGESLRCLTRFDFSAADNDCGMGRAEAYSQPDGLPEAAAHMSATYARTLTPMLGEKVDEILND